MWKEFKRLDDLAGAAFCLSNKRKLQHGLGHETVEIITEWKARRAVDSFKKEVSGCIGLTVMVTAYLITPAGCVFSSALDWKLWECLCSRNLGWCCLYCSFSAYVWNQCQQKTRLCFVFIHRHEHTRTKEESANRSSPCLYPDPSSWLSISFLLVCIFSSLPRLWNIWVSAQMNRHTEILVNL